jgi:hypothetical protein
VHMRLGGPQSQSGQRGEDKILHPTETQSSDALVAKPAASCYTDCTLPVSYYIHKLTIKYI